MRWRSWIDSERPGNRRRYSAWRRAPLRDDEERPLILIAGGTGFFLCALHPVDGVSAQPARDVTIFTGAVAKKAPLYDL